MFFFKKLLSYLVDIQLDTASTPLNPVLQLSLRRGRFYLTTTNAVYSHGDLYANFLKTFKRVDFAKNHFKTVLVLGFGMGSIPYMLERVFGQKFFCVGVEADAKIVEWAAQFVLPTLVNPVKLLVDDALVFIEKCSQEFDLVVVDIFLDDVIPPQIEAAQFLKKAKNLLAQNGLLLFNRLADTDAALATTAEFYENNFKVVFPEAAYLDVEGNWVLANRKAWD